MRGRIIRVSGLQCLVEVDDKLWQCEVRGRLKTGIRKTNSPVVAGDWVEIAATGDLTGIIELVHPRRSQFSRGANGPRPFEQILSANIEQLIVVVSAREPSPRIGFIDRAIIMANKGNTEAVLCVNKVDLISPDELALMTDPYKALGYPIHYTNALDGEGMQEFKNAIRDRISLVVGQSGVGKSTMLNFIEPGLGLKTREIMKRHDRGRHTTTAVQLFKLQQGGYIADTPGIKELRLWGIKSTDLQSYYPELEPLLGHCQFADCSHLHEPGCAIREAVATGQIHLGRYDGYRRIFENLKEDERANY